MDAPATPPLSPRAQPRAFVRPPRRGADRGTLGVLEGCVIEFERLASPYTRELRFQFERLAQVQAECDILRIRLTRGECDERSR